MSRSRQLQPATVSVAAKQAGEAQAQFLFGEENSRWAWVESSVWTDRMLTALENGVQGGKWFSMIDKSTRLPTWSRPRRKWLATAAVGIFRLPAKRCSSSLSFNSWFLIVRMVTSRSSCARY